MIHMWDPVETYKYPQEPSFNSLAASLITHTKFTTKIQAQPDPFSARIILCSALPVSKDLALKTEHSVSAFLPQLAKMPACLNSRYIIKPLDDSDLSQSTFSPPADDTSTEKSGVNKNQMDIWSSILSGKEEQDSITNLDHPPPYIHPMVKQSASSLSDKSLEICTESLGSETGSDGFSAYDPMAEDDEFGSDPPKYSTVKIKNGGYCERPALPPPLPSLSLQMRSRRENGRLVMEAVSVAPFESCFRAERQDGRLLLTLSDLSSEEDEEIVVPENHDAVAEVTSSGGLLKPYVYEFWRNKLQKPCKRTLVLLLKETIALPLLSNI